MKIFALPLTLENAAIIFDMDGTLYTHEEYLQSQIDLPIRRLAHVQGKKYEQMKTEIDQYRKNWADSRNGQLISLGNTFVAFGISIEENIRWREDLLHPENFLAKDKQLRLALQVLASRFSLVVATNNPVSVAVRTLSVLGVDDILEKIVGLDTCGVSKPDKSIFLKAAELCNTVPRQCISVGDRFDIDIALPLELGMGGILVDGVVDVYKLPEKLGSSSDANYFSSKFT